MSLSPLHCDDGSWCENSIAIYIRFMLFSIFTLRRNYDFTSTKVHVCELFLKRQSSSLLKKSFSSQLPIIVLKCYSETVIHLFIFIALTFSLWEILGFEKVSRAKQQCEISNNDKIDKTQAILKPGKYIFIKFVTQKAIVLPFISAIPFFMPPKCEQTYFMSYSTRNSHNISYYNISYILLTPKK